MQNSIWKYLQKDSFIHRLNSTFKLISLILMLISSCFINSYKDVIMLFRTNQTNAVKKADTRRNAHLLSREMPKIVNDDIPGIPKGPFVTLCQLFITENITTWMPSVKTTK